jgi:predicted enzyme related to lactoylglutathione lyase
LARDPGDEAVFYQKVFGYAVLGEPTDQGFRHIQLSAGAHERASVQPLPGGADALNPQWISFARVANTAETVRQAVKLGAHILVATRAPGAVFTILADPTGAAFGVIELPPAVVSLETR